MSNGFEETLRPSCEPYQQESNPNSNPLSLSSDKTIYRSHNIANFPPSDISAADESTHLSPNNSLHLRNDENPAMTFFSDSPSVVRVGRLISSRNSLVDTTPQKPMRVAPAIPSDNSNVEIGDSINYRGLTNLSVNESLNASSRERFKVAKFGSDSTSVRIKVSGGAPSNTLSGGIDKDLIIREQQKRISSLKQKNDELHHHLVQSQLAIEGFAKGMGTVGDFGLMPRFSSPVAHRRSFSGSPRNSLSPNSTSNISISIEGLSGISSTNDPFAPNKELYQHFMNTVEDDRTKKAGETLLNQLSVLARKVNVLMRMISREREMHTKEMEAVSEKRSDGDSDPIDETIMKNFLAVVKASAVQLAYKTSVNCSFSSKFMVPKNDEMEVILSTSTADTIQVITEALEASTSSVEKMRSRLDTVLTNILQEEQQVYHRKEALSSPLSFSVPSSLDSKMDMLLSLPAYKGLTDQSQESEAIAEKAASLDSPMMFTLAKIVDVLGGYGLDPTKATHEALQDAATAEAAKARSSIETLTRELNIINVSIEEYERAVNYMLTSLGVVEEESTPRVADVVAANAEVLETEESDIYKGLHYTPQSKENFISSTKSTRSAKSVDKAIAASQWLRKALLKAEEAAGIPEQTIPGDIVSKPSLQLRLTTLTSILLNRRISLTTSPKKFHPNDTDTNNVGIQPSVSLSADQYNDHRLPYQTGEQFPHNNPAQLLEQLEEWKTNEKKFRSNIIPILPLPLSIPADAPFQDLLDATVLALQLGNWDSSQDGRRASELDEMAYSKNISPTSVPITSSTDTVLLKTYVHQIDRMLTDHDPDMRWEKYARTLPPGSSLEKAMRLCSSLGSPVGVLSSSIDGGPNRESKNSSHSDVHKALIRLSARQSLLLEHLHEDHNDCEDAASMTEGSANPRPNRESHEYCPPTTSHDVNQKKDSSTVRNVDSTDSGINDEDSRYYKDVIDRALQRLAQIIPKTAISAAVQKRGALEGTGSAKYLVATNKIKPPTDDIETMCGIIEDRIAFLQQELQRAFRNADFHRNEKINIEKCLHEVGPVVAAALSASLITIKTSSAQLAHVEDGQNNTEVLCEKDDELDAAMATEYPIDSVGTSDTFTSYYEPLLRDIEARALALKTKTIRLSYNHKTDRNRLANYASSHHIWAKRWRKTAAEAFEMCQLLGVPTDDIQLLASNPGAELPEQDRSHVNKTSLGCGFATNASTTALIIALRGCRDKLAATVEGGTKRNDGNTTTVTSCDGTRVDAEGAIRVGQLETRVFELQGELSIRVEERITFQKALILILEKMGRIAQHTKKMIFILGPEQSDVDDQVEDIMKRVCGENTEDGHIDTMDSDECEDALALILNKLIRWVSYAENLSVKHIENQREITRYMTVASAILCGQDEEEVFDANLQDIDTSLVRACDGILYHLREPTMIELLKEYYIKGKGEDEKYNEGGAAVESVMAGPEQDHRLLRLHGVVTKIHRTVEGLEKVRYLSIPGLVNDTAADDDISHFSNSSPIFLDIDPEANQLNTTEIVRLIEQNMRHIEGALNQLSNGYKLAVILLQRDIDAMQGDLASMISKLSQVDVEEAFGMSRNDLHDIFEILKDRQKQKGCYFFNREKNGEGPCPWTLALKYLQKTYGPILDILTAKSDSLRLFRSIVDKSMDEAAEYLQGCQNVGIPLPQEVLTDVRDSKDNTNKCEGEEHNVDKERGKEADSRKSQNSEVEIQLYDEHLPAVIKHAANLALQGNEVREQEHSGKIAKIKESFEHEAENDRIKREKMLDMIAELRDEVARITLEKDALISEAAIVRAQLRRTDNNQRREKYEQHPLGGDRNISERRYDNSETYQNYGQQQRGSTVRHDIPYSRHMSTSSNYSQGSARRSPSHLRQGSHQQPQVGQSHSIQVKVYNQPLPANQSPSKRNHASRSPPMTYSEQYKGGTFLGMHTEGDFSKKHFCPEVEPARINYVASSNPGEHCQQSSHCAPVSKSNINVINNAAGTTTGVCDSYRRDRRTRPISPVRSSSRKRSSMGWIGPHEVGRIVPPPSDHRSKQKEYVDEDQQYRKRKGVHVSSNIISPKPLSSCMLSHSDSTSSANRHIRDSLGCKNMNSTKDNEYFQEVGAAIETILKSHNVMSKGKMKSGNRDMKENENMNSLFKENQLHVRPHRNQQSQIQCINSSKTNTQVNGGGQGVVYLYRNDEDENGCSGSGTPQQPLGKIIYIENSAIPLHEIAKTGSTHLHEKQIRSRAASETPTKSGRWKMR